jgi:serine/threonine protein kinase
MDGRKSSNRDASLTCRYMFTTLHPHSAAHVQEPWEHTQLVTFFRRLCMTVHSLHCLNVSHEDLKRSNVLVDPVGCPSLIDFGFSHFAAYGQRVRSAGGTLDYTSPQKVEVSTRGERELMFRMLCTMAPKMTSGV